MHINSSKSSKAQKTELRRSAQALQPADHCGKKSCLVVPVSLMKVSDRQISLNAASRMDAKCLVASQRLPSLHLGESSRRAARKHPNGFRLRASVHTTAKARQEGDLTSPYRCVYRCRLLGGPASFRLLETSSPFSESSPRTWRQLQKHRRQDTETRATVKTAVASDQQLYEALECSPPAWPRSSSCRSP